jgi:S1-C subfamily serine protease
LSRTLQFRDSNLEVVSLVNPPTDFDGVIAGPGGAVRAMWSSFSAENNRELVQFNRGIPAELAAEALAAARSGEPLYSLEAEFSLVPLASARQLGVGDAWLRQMEAHSPTRRQILSVARVVAGSPAVGVLREGDLLLAIDGKPVNRFREVERASQAPQVRLTIVRDGVEQTVALTTAALRGSDIDRLLVWAGAVLHAPHRAMAQQRGIPPDGVFVAYFSYGSPATRYHLFAGRRIVEVDGRATPDLDTFIEAVRGRTDRAALRLRTVTWNGSTEVITLKLDKHYWPAYELVRSSAGWERRELD